MPEMPEVETIARRLRRSILGKRIARVRLSGLPLRVPVDAGFAARLRGRIVRRIHRRGKYIVIELEPSGFCLVHLGMSGRVFYRPEGLPGEKHTQAILRFSDGSELEYRDHRRFGLLALHEAGALEEIPEIRALGLEPLGDGFTEAALKELLRASRREIKDFLLDQRRIAGLGNIYACEALFRARIHPERRACSLTAREAGRLAEAVRAVLKDGIRHGGTSIADFRNLDGKRGRHQEFLSVYQREGERCGRCGAVIRRLTQANRSTFFCPRCQRKKRLGSDGKEG